MTREEQVAAEKAACTRQTEYVARTEGENGSLTIECHYDRDKALEGVVATGFGISRERVERFGGRWPESVEVGMDVTVYTHRGSMIRGLDLEGREVFFALDDELKEEHTEWVADLHERRARELEENRDELTTQLVALPDPLRKRIERFKAEDPNFDRDAWPYEQFCCVEAVKIQRALRPYLRLAKADDVWDWFMKLDVEQQKLVVPDLSDEHSGNTFGGARVLAYWLTVHPEVIADAADPKEWEPPVPYEDPHVQWSELPPYVVAISGDILPGPSTPEDAKERRDPWTWRAVPQLSKAEAEWIMRHRPVIHMTYSMQQQSFAAAGFEIRDSRVVIPKGITVLGIGTRDRYGIFEEGTTVVEFHDAAEWRASDYYAERLGA